MKTSTFATLFFIGSVVSSPHRHLHHHVARHSNQQEESSVVWVTEVVVKTVQVTATVWVTPLAEPTHTIEERPAGKEIIPTPNTPAQLFESRPSTDKDTPPSEIAAEKGVDTNEIFEPQPPTEEHTPSSEIAAEEGVDTTEISEPQPPTEEYTSSSEIAAEKGVDTSEISESQPPTEENNPSSKTTSEKSDHSHDETTIENRPSETVAQSQVNTGKNNEATKPLTDEVNDSKPSTPPEPITYSSQTPSDASLGSNITAIQDHATAATCSPSSPCNGDITFYDPGVGYGACGWKNSKNEPVVALPHEFMGSKSNGNSYCGKTITIVRDGKKSTARVVDKCMGCTGYSIDLSDAVFSQLAALSVGRTSAKWWVN